MSENTLKGKLAVRAAGAVGDSIFDLIERQKPALERALPKVGITADRFIRVVHTQLRMNPALADCTPASLLGAVMLSAQLGLEPGPLGHAYLVPFRNNKLDRMECQFIVGYKGLVNLAYRANIVLVAYTIHENDLFEQDYGTDYVSHKVPLSGSRGQVIGAWAKAVLPGGRRLTRVLTKEEIEAHRGRSRAANSGPWVTDYEAMAAKTAARALCAFVPLDTVSLTALAADESTVVYNTSTDTLEGEGIAGNLIINVGKEKNDNRVQDSRARGEDAAQGELPGQPILDGMA